MRVYCAVRIPITTTYASLARWLQPTPSTPVLSMNVAKTNFADWCVGAAARMAMTTAVVPTACHQMDTLLMYFRRCTPNVLISPWQMSTPAYMPIVVRASGMKEVLKVASVEMKFAAA